MLEAFNAVPHNTGAMGQFLLNENMTNLILNLPDRSHHSALVVPLLEVNGFLGQRNSTIKGRQNVLQNRAVVASG